MQKPNPRKPEHLVHPKGDIKAFNGDRRKQPNRNRWSHAPDMEDRGATIRREEQGLTVVAGTRPPSRVSFKHGKLTSIPEGELNKSGKGAIQPIPEDHTFTPAMRHDTQPLKDNGPQVFSIGGQPYSPYSKPSKAQLQELNAPVAKPKTARQKRQTHSS